MVQSFFIRTTKVLTILCEAQADLGLRKAHMLEGTFSHIAVHRIKRFN